MLLKCCTHYFSKFGKLSRGHRTWKGQVSFQFQRKAMPNSVPTPIQIALISMPVPSNFTFTFHFHALEKEMATHSSVLAWSIPGTGEPGGLPSMRSHRVGHDWSDLAAAWYRSKSFKLALRSKGTMKFHRHNLGLVQAEEQEIKLPSFPGLCRKQGNSRKISPSLSMLKLFTVNHKKLRKILREMGAPDHLTCLLRPYMQEKKQQLESDMEQWTGSKLRKSMSRLYTITLLI